MNKHRRLVFVVLISLTFGTFVACDADQQSNADEIASDAPTSTNAGDPSSAEKSLEIIDPAIVGKYVNLKKPGSYLVLNADGTFVMPRIGRFARGSEPYSGNFSIKGDQLRLQMNEKQSTKMQFVDGGIETRTGDRWEKE